MSLLDTRYPDLDLFLQGWRRRLNTRVFAGEALASWTAAAPVAAVAALVFQPNLGPRFAWATALAALGSLGFVLWRRRRRLTRHEAASWLDERGKTQGLFRAASECLDRPAPGRGGESVLAEADRRRTDFRGATAPRLPWRRLALRGLLALGATSLAVGLLGLTPPVSVPLGPPSEAAGAVQAPSLTPDLPDGTRELGPQEAAKRLFPEDARLAALAEQALAAGDPGALESLLEQNAVQAGKRTSPPGAPAPGGQPGQNPGQAGSQEGSPGPRDGETAPGTPGSRGTPSPGGKQSPGSETSPGSKKNAPGKPESSSEGQDPSTGSLPGQAPGGASPGSNEGGGQSQFPSGGAPGTGHSQQPLGTAPRTGSSDRQLALKDQENPGVFEYVLPGTGPQLPTAQALADSRRSAEAVISRTSPPLEFENTIRDYFLSLTTLTKAQEASP